MALKNMVEQDSNTLFRSALWDCPSAGRGIPGLGQFTLGATPIFTMTWLIHAKVLVKQGLRAAQFP